MVRPGRESNSRGSGPRTYSCGVSELIHRVEATIVQRQLLPKGAAVLLAVSGGLDSMVLLRVLHELSAPLGWRLVVAHCNHQLRGAESDADERLVARAAKKLGLEFVSASVSVKELARQRKLSLEMAARALRHDFLARSARASGLSHIALAHHADDQVELFFIRLLRGAGTQGLGGMEWRAPSPVDGRIALVRPLLGETKSALAAFARARRITFREDATNRLSEIPRNRIRHKLLPRLRREYQPAMDSVVLRAMELIHDEGEFVTGEAMRWLKLRRRDRAFDELPVALQRRVMQIELLRAGSVPEFDAVEHLRLRPETWLTLGPNQVCRRTPAGRIEQSVPVPTFRTERKEIDPSARTRRAKFGGVELKWGFIPGGALPVRGAPETEFFDARAAGRRIILRHWQAGDRFQPTGLSSPVKLQDLFVNQKIARTRRCELVLATTPEGEIFWVEGLRISERFKVTAGTERQLRWQWHRP